MQTPSELHVQNEMKKIILNNEFPDLFYLNRDSNYSRDGFVQTTYRDPCVGGVGVGTTSRIACVLRVF